MFTQMIIYKGQRIITLAHQLFEPMFTCFQYCFSLTFLDPYSLLNNMKIPAMCTVRILAAPESTFHSDANSGIDKQIFRTLDHVQLGSVNSLVQPQNLPNLPLFQGPLNKLALCPKISLSIDNAVGELKQFKLSFGFQRHENVTSGSLQAPFMKQEKFQMIKQEQTSIAIIYIYFI